MNMLAIFDQFSMEERMTACNMSLKVEPVLDMSILIKKPTISSKDAHIHPRRELGTAIEAWSFASDTDCQYDDIVKIDANDISPTVTWGINPTRISVEESIPEISSVSTEEAASTNEALEYMKPHPKPIKEPEMLFYRF